MVREHIFCPFWNILYSSFPRSMPKYYFRSEVCSDLITSHGDEVELALKIRIYPYAENALACWVMFACQYRCILWGNPLVMSTDFSVLFQIFINKTSRSDIMLFISMHVQLYVYYIFLLLTYVVAQLMFSSCWTWYYVITFLFINTRLCS